VRVQDANGCSTTKGYTLVIACPTVAVSGTLPSAAVQDTAYGNQTLTVSGGTAPYTWTVIGSLPTGLSLTSGATPTTARISGTPTVVQSVTFTIRATDVNGCFKDTGYTIAVGCPVTTISPSAVGPFTQYRDDEQSQLQRRGGRTPYIWSATGVPAGLSFSGGVLKRSPHRRARQLRDECEPDGQQRLSGQRFLHRGDRLQRDHHQQRQRAAERQRGHGLPQTPTATLAGTSVPAQTWSWSLDSGSLPAGLTLSAAGVVGGTPTEAASASMVISCDQHARAASARRPSP